MARTMSIDNTDIYRTVVDQLFRGDLEADAIQTTTYGPHDSKSSNRDYTDSEWARSLRRSGPRRITKQQLDIDMGGEHLVWATYSVTYTNGGEDVNWGE